MKEQSRVQFYSMFKITVLQDPQNVTNRKKQDILLCILLFCKKHKENVQETKTQKKENEEQTDLEKIHNINLFRVNTHKKHNKTNEIWEFLLIIHLK